MFNITFYFQIITLPVISVQHNILFSDHYLSCHKCSTQHCFSDHYLTCRKCLLQNFSQIISLPVITVQHIFSVIAIQCIFFQIITLPVISVQHSIFLPDHFLTCHNCFFSDPASGLTMEYAKGVAGIKYSVTPELRGNGFDPPNSEIEPSFQETWNGVFVYAMGVRDATRK